jgi:Domain of unknown function (DUF4333)
VKHWLVLVVACCAAALAGCGNGEKKLSAAKIEAAIERGAEAGKKGFKVFVHCPKGMPARKGLVFTCTVRTSTGLDTIATITVLDKKGTIRYDVPSSQ